MGRRAPGGWERRAGAERRAVAATGLGDILYSSSMHSMILLASRVVCAYFCMHDVWSYQRARIFPTKSSYYSSTSYF